MKTLSIALLCAFVSLEAASAAAGAAQEAVPSNYDVLAGISEDAARSLVAALQPAPAGSVVRLVKARGVGDADFLVENAFIERLRGAGFRTGVEAKAQEVPADTGAYTLSYQVIRLAVRYTRISRRYWFGSKEVVREARADVTAQLIDRRTGDVLWIREGSGRYDDVIPYSLLSSVEEKQYEFTRPVRSEFKMSRVIEPVVVAGIVVGLVALFFSNQSGQ
jgi:hypothetical protein